MRVQLHSVLAEHRHAELTTGSATDWAERGTETTIRLTNRSTGDHLTDIEIVADRDGAQRLASVLSAAAARDSRQEVQMEWRHEPTNRTTQLRVIVVALGLMLSACSTTDTYTPDDGRYVSESITSRDGAHTLFENTPVRVEIRRAGDEAAEVSWTADCNVMSAETQLRQSRLVVVGDVAATEIGCDERDQAQDDWLTELFTSDPLWQQDDDTLVVRSEDGTATIELRSTAASEAETDDHETALTPTVSPHG